MHKKYDLVIFDVDGTLHDSFVSIAMSYQYTMKERFGVEHPDLDHFRPCIGPPIQQCFTMLGVEEENIPEAIEIYQRFFKEHAQDVCKFFPGTEAMLADFEAAGIDMAIASSKHVNMINYLMTRDGVLDYFGVVSGVWDVLEDAPKKVLIERVLDHFSVTDKSRVVMVGDRHYDAEGAKQAGVDFIAAGYGMGEPGEFDAYPVVFFARDIDEVRRYVLGENIE